MIELPPVDRPEVSVVVVTYGRWPLVRAALEALVANTDPVYELIVVDNASIDDTTERLAIDVRGATLVFNDRNYGFGAAANLAAQRAVGRYLCFLNSDAIVTPGWLPPLVARLQTDPHVGAVVPCLLHQDGTLQEAGSLVGCDASTRAYGDGDDPGRPPYRFARVIDYGSAACLLMRRDAFGAVGGFDVVYDRAYCEDVDLALSLRQHGWVSMYEPASTVVHLRHGSSSAAEAEALVLANRAILRQRWAAELDQRPTLEDIDRRPHRLLAARDGVALDRILVIDDRVPHADQGSGDGRAAALLLELAGQWPEARVTLLATTPDAAEHYAPPLWQAGVEVVWWAESWDEWFEQRRYHYSTVIVSRPHNHERFGELVRRTQPQASVVYDAEALYFRRLQRQATLAARGAERTSLEAEADRMLLVEAAAARAADAIFCMSEEEASVLQGLAPGVRCHRLPDAVDAASPVPPRAGREGLLFFGGFMAGAGSPNEDAVVHLVDDVLPGLRVSHPDVTLDVVGARPTDRVIARASERVRVTGQVPDPSPWLARARVHVAPLRYGAGVKRKLLDSMAMGLPFVTTPVGAEGIGLGPLERLVVGETPDELAHLTARLLDDDDRWEHVQQGLLTVLRDRFGTARFRRVLIDAMADLGLAPPTTSGASGGFVVAVDAV